MLDGILQTFLISMLPLVELRLGMPFGYARFDLPILIAGVVATLGTILSVALLLRCLPFLINLSLKVPFLKKIIEKVFEKTRAKHSEKVVHLGELALVIFVAVPIPGSGGWGGALIAYLFGLSYWKSLKFISIGLVFAGLIVGFLTVGIDKLIQLF